MYFAYSSVVVVCLHSFGRSVLVRSEPRDVDQTLPGGLKPHLSFVNHQEIYPYFAEYYDESLKKI